MGDTLEWQMSWDLSANRRYTTEICWIYLCYKLTVAKYCTVERIILLAYTTPSTDNNSTKPIITNSKQAIYFQLSTAFRWMFHNVLC